MPESLQAGYIALVLAFGLCGVNSQLALFRGGLDVLPPYLAHANVSLAVVQDGDYRNFLWTADWLGSAISGDMNMGRMTCPMSEAERKKLSVLPLEERNHLVVPCNFRDADELVAGSDVVRRVVASVAALGAKRVAMVGLGPGTMATYWQRYHPQIERIDVVEMSSTVVDIARRYFGLHADGRLRVHISEGMDWLRQAETFDVFVHDATGSQHLFLWPSALQLIREKTEGGAMVINLCGAPASVRALLIPYLRLHFAEVRAYNNVVVASWSPCAMNWEGLPENVRAWQELDAQDTYKSLSVGTVALVSVLVLAAILGVLLTKANAKVVVDEELAPLTKLHPRARVRSELCVKDCIINVLPPGSRPYYGVV
mmetsp:Transcript_63119/g.174972  ORF Transcript_63119/g.174972 Transcript_63119/m.174972 type:complete len:370 (-) Transcript_63119:74-1183(-)